MTMEIRPTTLTGKFIRLEPLAISQAAELSLASANASIWKYMLYGDVIDEPRMSAWIADLLNRAKNGTELPFAVRDLTSDRLIGATRFMDIRAKDKGLEIGGTWYAPEFQRTYVNTEAKFLLLRHAFEIYECVRVQLKTDSSNTRSIAAIERIGAKREGVLRNHMLLADGTLRDSVYFSVIDSEWPLVKQNLEKILYYA